MTIYTTVTKISTNENSCMHTKYTKQTSKFIVGYVNCALKVIPMTRAKVSSKLHVQCEVTKSSIPHFLNEEKILLNFSYFGKHKVFATIALLCFTAKSVLKKNP